ncbi:MAG: DUF4091 domain-containing protein [Ruminococcaceae bacterium]|nr:DUF4091 domain-containing protein [Oscillospiraceae bacterium]
MAFQIQQVSSLEKVRAGYTYDTVAACTALRGERVSWQVAITSEDICFLSVAVESPLKEHVRLYRVQEAVLDQPATEDVTGDGYLTEAAGTMPDILVPLTEDDTAFTLGRGQRAVVWVKLDVPADAPAGDHPVRVVFTVRGQAQTAAETVTAEMTVTVAPAVIARREAIYTRWFYLDCIATAHGVEVFSEEHWALIDKYVAAAADMGINMLLVPTHTPPLDTEVGTARPCVQLVDIEKTGDTYTFGFEKFRRYIALCQKHGIRYFETAHMFSQWGAKCAPNILVTENGETTYRFGWHVPSDDPAYIAFLQQYIAAIAAEVKALGIEKQTYYHISDEPNMTTMATYQTAADLLRPLLGASKTLDALSDYAFYERGLVQCPVTSVAHIAEFLKHDVPEQWVYYCCGPQTVYPNSFMAMPSARVRILGFLMYKYDIKGFLHWGYNFYNSAVSRYPVDPYLTTSCDGTYPSGDPFIVYPAKDGVYPSIRGEVTFHAMQDIALCRTLEEKIGRRAVVGMIDRAAGGELRFDSYPKENGFLLSLHEEMVQKLGE